MRASTRWSPAPPRFDVQAPVLSLPRIFATTLDTVPDSVPYLAAPELHNLDLPRAAGSKLSVGIVWAGSPTQANDRRRSCPMDRFLALMGVPGVDFFSLQKGAAAKQLQSSAAAALVTDLGGRLQDFADTVAVVDELDLVIAVDTAVVDGAVNGTGWLTIAFSWISHVLDKYVVDGIVNLVGWVAKEGSYVFRRVQTGLIQNYAFATLLGVFAFVTWYIYSLTGR